MVFREFKKVNILVEGQTEKEKEYFRYIKLKNHMRTRLPRTYQKSEMIYDDVDLKRRIRTVGRSRNRDPRRLLDQPGNRRSRW